MYDNFSNTTFNDYNIEKDIKIAEERINKKKKDIEDLEYELDLVKKDTYYKLVSHMTGMELYDYDLAAKGLNMIKTGKDSEGNKIDKRKKYKEIDTFNWLTNTLKIILELDELTITDIIDFNYGEAKWIEFDYGGHGWVLKSPIPGKIRYQSFEYSGSYPFKFDISHKDSNSHITAVDCTFRKEELKNIMKKGIEKYITNAEVKDEDTK